jgi:NAD(P)H-flavin reductase
MSAAMVPALTRITEVRPQTADSVTLTLQRPALWPDPRPGQFHMLWVFGVGEAAISICGLDDPATIEHTVRAVGNASDALCRLKPGQAVGLRGPYGRGWPETGPRDLLIVAGGIGLAPLRPVIQSRLETGRQRAARTRLFYGARSTEELLFRDDLGRWAADPAIDVAVTVDRADPDWLGHTGVVTGLLADSEFDAGRTAALVCGPEPMMCATARALADRGLSADDIWLSVERNMQCAVGLCGHCQLGPDFLCRDGPVLPWSRLCERLAVAQL